MRKGSPPGGGRQAAVSPNTVGQGLGQVSSPRGAEDSQLWRSCRRAAHSGESDHLVGPDCVDDSDSLQTPQSPRVPPSGRSARWPLSQPQSSRTELSLTLTPCTQLSGVACRVCPPPVSHRLGAVTHMAPSTPGPHVSTSNLSARGSLEVGWARTGRLGRLNVLGAEAPELGPAKGLGGSREPDLGQCGHQTDREMAKIT